MLVESYGSIELEVRKRRDANKNSRSCFMGCTIWYRHWLFTQEGSDC